MNAGRVVLVGGGVRSGKSRFALELALTRGAHRLFVATAQAFDDEMKDRIARHQAERADTFETVEAPTELVATLRGLSDGIEVVLNFAVLGTVLQIRPSLHEVRKGA